MKRIKIGVLGVSNHFIKRIILPLKALNCFEVYAIASRSENKASETAREYGIAKTFGSYQQLLDDASIEAVYIPLPNHMHAQWIKKAAFAGKHVLCEKPMCMDANEAIEVVEHCQRCNVVLMEAFMYKYHPQWIMVRDIIRTNNIGSISYINTSFSYNNPSAQNIRNIKEYGGGGLRDIGCYAISVARFLLGKEPKQVISLMEEHPEFKTDMLSSGILDFGKARTTFNVATCANAFQKVDVVGTAGRITVDIPFNTYTDVPAKFVVDSAIGTRQVTVEAHDQYGLMFEEFAKLIGKNETISSVDDDAILNQKVIDAVLRSSATKVWEPVG